MAKPIVDGLERELDADLQILRVNVMDQVGARLAQRYSVRMMPTFVLLNNEGEVVLTQAGMPNRDEIVSKIAELSE